MLAILKSFETTLYLSVMKFVVSGLFLFVLLIAICMVVALLHGKLSWLPVQRRNRRLLAVGFTGLSLAAAAGIGLTYTQLWQKPDLTTTKQAVQTQELQKVKVQAAPAGLAQYQILGKTGTKDSVRLQVVTKEVDRTQLILLNDYLYSTYRGTSQAFFIDYFNDKTVASTYFIDQADSKLSQTQKDELFSHYVATMVDMPFMPTKVFYLQGRPKIELKQY